MDFTTTKTIEVTKLALNGLMERQNAIASNTANVFTPNYQRKEVTFEKQLKEIIEKEDLKKDLRTLNSTLPPDKTIAFNTTNNQIEFQDKGLPSEILKFMSQNDFNSFDPEVIRDTSEFDPITQNNVCLEKEMIDMAKAGMKYNVLATLEGKMFTGLSDVIKSGGNA